MSLAKLLTKKRLTILGINSGTSADGLDFALVRATRNGKGANYKYLHGASRKFPVELRNEILDVAGARSVPPERLIELDQTLGELVGRQARAFARRAEQAGTRVDLIASHGQTVRHLPRPRNGAMLQSTGTLQLGNLARIAAVSAKPVIGDFRQADVAVWNEGAPITTEAMVRLFRHKSETRVIVNIGGIANYFYLSPTGSGQPIEAADCGPGNCLCDILAKELLGEPCDRGGRHARAGKPSMRLLSILHAHPFLLGKTKSTGREDFGEKMARDIISFGERRNLNPDDLLASAAELTACSIATRVETLASADQSRISLYLTGGGSRNRFFVKRIRELLPGFEVKSIKELGMEPTQVEAASYAVLADTFIQSEPISGSNPGGKAYPVVGCLVQPPHKR